MSPLANDELVGSVAGPGDRATLDDLVRQNVDFVYATARRHLRDSHLAEDVTQAVFLVLLQKRAPVKPQHLARWLFKTTRYAAANAKRMQIRRTHYESLAPVRMGESASDAEPDAMIEILDDALASLRQSERAVLILRYLCAMEIAEVSRVVGLNETATRKRISRALGKLRECFVARGVGRLSEAAIVAGMQGVAEKAPSSLSNVILSGTPSENAVSISQRVRTMPIFFVAKTGVLAILAIMALICANKLVRNLSTAATQLQSPLAPPAAASAPATQPGDDNRSDLNVCARRMLDIGNAISRYSAAHQRHLPSSLGQTFRYIQPYSEWTQTQQKRGTPKERATLYLTPADTKTKVVPENPDPQWIDENTSFVYIGDPGVVTSDIRPADWRTTVIAHTKLDEPIVVQVNGKLTNLIPVLMLDGHEEAFTVETAKKIIEESKKRYGDLKLGL